MTPNVASLRRRQLLVNHDATAIERGRYLAMVAACTSCHMADLRG